MRPYVRRPSVLHAGLVLAVALWSDVCCGWSPDQHRHNASEGFAAKTWFETVSAAEVTAVIGAMGAFSETYALDPNPDSYKAKDRGLTDLKSVTLVWRDGFEKSPFVFDLFVHGALSDAEGLAFRLSGLDIRKFLPQPITSENEDFVRLQAYFEEFSRKGKLIYRRPRQQDSIGTRGYEEEELEVARERLEGVLAERERISSASHVRIDRIIALFRAPQPIDLAAVEQSLHLGIRDAAADPETVGRLQRVLSTVKALSSGRNINYVKLVNNCREPGNYEISLEDWVGRPALRASFAFSPDVYDRILKSYFGLGIDDIGTGIRFSRSISWGEPERYWRSFLPWEWYKSVPDVSVRDVVKDVSAAAKPARQRKTGPIEVAHGRIPYEVYEIEVRSKAAYQTFREPLSYVRVDPEKAMPTGFLPPDGSAPARYWAARSGEIVAHKFVLFEDLQRYDVYLSGFEVNGVYIGQSDLVDYDRLRKRGRWHFDYSYLGHLRRYELSEDAAGRVWIRLSGDAENGSVNFLIGNLSLSVGEAIEYPFGVGTQPLVSDYNDNVFQEFPRYALAYGRNGAVLDHHDLRIGVERVYVERQAEDAYKLRLVAHERILPVWEGLIRLSQR